MGNRKINIEIIPEDNVDVNKLRNRIHTFIKLIRKGCKSIRSYVVTIKDDTK